ncbi:MAG TPA: glycosyl hydrolase family 28-related protein, partial [Anaerolineales bacterium]|nr:glycosyl hydrolase family 28-related protein [Anaerolineales bacterium]
QEVMQLIEEKLRQLNLGNHYDIFCREHNPLDGTHKESEAIEPSSFNAPWVDVRDYGEGVGIGGDWTVAFRTAISDAPPGGKIFAPNGTYGTTDTITISDGKSLVGQSKDYTIIRPTSAVTTSVIVNNGSLEKIYVDGVNTSGKTGVVCGSALSAGTKLVDVKVQNFTGGSAIGVKVRQVVGASFLRCYFNGNTNCVFVTPEAGDGTPTTTWFQDTSFREATEQGVLITGGYQVNFLNCIFESNYQEGLKIVPGASANAIFGILRSCWFENNWRDDEDRTSEYSLVVDGTAVGCSVGVHLDTVYFNGTAETEKSIDFNKVKWTSLSKVTTPVDVAGAIRVQDATSEVTFIDDAGRTALTNVANADGAYVWYPIQYTLNAAGIQTLTLSIYANNAAAIAGGLVAGQLYRTNADPDTICVVH